MRSLLEHLPDAFCRRSVAPGLRLAVICDPARQKIHALNPLPALPFRFLASLRAADDFRLLLAANQREQATDQHAIGPGEVVRPCGRIDARARVLAGGQDAKRGEVGRPDEPVERVDGYVDVGVGDERQNLRQPLLGRADVAAGDVDDVDDPDELCVVGLGDTLDRVVLAVEASAVVAGLFFGADSCDT